jgi:hypothetical protein
MFTGIARRRKPFFHLAALFVAALVGLSAVPARAEFQLLMVEQMHCEWCEAWNEEIGVVYDKTDEGRRAPLRRVDLFDTMPDGITIAGQVHFTPTFVLLENGREVGRIEGYPGEHFFWPMLEILLDRAEKANKKGTGS